MQQVPLSASPSQTFSLTVGGQNCQINVYTKQGALYFDLYVNSAPIILGVLCENANRLVRSLYLGFIGDFIFYDTQGTNDPAYTGLGSRYQLLYLATSDLTDLGFAA